MTSTVRRRAADEHGAALILFSLLCTALMVMVSLALEFGAVRDDRQTNKSSADFAAAAGIHHLDNGSSTPQPWKGVCAAFAYLQANDPRAASLTVQHLDGNDLPLGGDPCAPPTDPAFDPAYHTLCDRTSADPAVRRASWAKLLATSTDGRFQVEVASGYELPDARFSRIDTTLLGGGDTGDPVQRGCDQLAVVIDEDNPPVFSGLIGAGDQGSRIRSVARVQVGTTSDAPAALLLLERSDCRVLSVLGSSGARIEVLGTGDYPGFIHADSLGNGADCDAGDPETGNIYQVDSNPGFPAIVAGEAETPAGGEADGIISSRSLTGEPGAVAAVTSSPSPVEVCASRQPGECPVTPPIAGALPSPRALVTRSPLDERYRQPITQLRNLAQQRFAWTSSADLPPGWTEVGCSDPGPFTATRIWVNCGGGVFNGNGKTFTASVEDLVINGSVVVDSNGKTLHVVAPRTLFIKGSTSGNGLELKGKDNNILINDGGATDGDSDGYACDERFAAAPSARTKMVVGSGPVIAEGGENKVLRMCQTTLYLMDDSGSPGCPLPTSDGIAPYSNGCRGRIRVAGQNKLDWSAPNVNNLTLPTRLELDELEDLAFWTETSGSGTSISAIEGNGGVRLVGIFFTPNANPFRVGGNGAYDIEQAQFLTRKLEVAGNGTLRMRPTPQNALQVPFFENFQLVR